MCPGFFHLQVSCVLCIMTMFGRFVDLIPSIKIYVFVSMLTYVHKCLNT